MTSVTLSPCPFCGGPPKVVVRNYRTGAVPEQEDYGQDGVYVEAYVFCHECGAHGSRHVDVIHGSEEWRAARGEAIKGWQQRDTRHRDLYDVILATKEAA
jgi:hypothetical protein